MRYYVIAGEASGDLHASNLVKEISKLDNNSDFRGWGGDMMQAEGVSIVKHYRELAFMGFTEVLMNISTILNNIKLCKEDILNYKPDVVILIDYPGFNLRIAPFLKQNGIKVFYYISPQVWAWKQSRVKKIKEFVDKMFVILPFEKDFYSKFNYAVDFVGHPLLDAVSTIKKEDDFVQKFGLDAKPLVAILPGSRKQEIEQMLPVMINVAKRFNDFQFVIAGAPSIEEVFYKNIIKDSSIKLISGKTYQLLLHAKAAMVTSGTATLETALFGVPEVVCYKGGKISFMIAKQLVKVSYISLVNLILDREVVKELIQDNFNEETLYEEMNELLYNKEYINKVEVNYKGLREKLGGSGASEKTAQLMVSYLKGAT